MTSFKSKVTSAMVALAGATGSFFIKFFFHLVALS